MGNVNRKKNDQRERGVREKNDQPKAVSVTFKQSNHNAPFPMFRPGFLLKLHGFKASKQSKGLRTLHAMHARTIFLPFLLLLSPTVRPLNPYDPYSNDNNRTKQRLQEKEEQSAGVTKPLATTPTDRYTNRRNMSTNEQKKTAS